MSDPKHILLVDDDQDVVDSNRTLLESNGYRVSAAYGGAEGIETAKRDRPDLVILDVMMATETEGFGVNATLRDIPELKDTPVIMLSAINKDTNRPYRFDVDHGWPCVEFLEKPVLPETLLTKVKEYAG